MVIRNYNDFISSLLSCGFSIGGGRNDGIFSLLWSWNESPPYETPVRWHTGDKETDPWEWRIRVVTERDDIACSKLFFNKTGYITRDWYPYFLAARRPNLSFEDDYAAGMLSVWEKRVYDCIRKNGRIAYHNIKITTGFTAADKSKFERAIVALQMKMYITSCGQEQKLSQMGIPYGWPSMVFCTAEDYMGTEVFDAAMEIGENEAVEKITAQVYRLNPDADSKNIMKFITG